MDTVYNTLQLWKVLILLVGVGGHPSLAFGSPCKGQGKNGTSFIADKSCRNDEFCTCRDMHNNYGNTQNELKVHTSSNRNSTLIAALNSYYLLGSTRIFFKV